MNRVIMAGNAITADILNSYISSDTRYQVVALTVDDEYSDQGGIPGLETIPVSRIKQKYKPGDYAVIMAMGYDNLNKTREAMFYKLREMGYRIETYVHPDARIYSGNPPGEGCVVLPAAVIEPHVSIGANTMVWCNTTLAHHSSIGEHCWVASGAVISGQACVKNNTFIGVNATIVNQVTVAEYNIIGGGALITKNTKPSTVHLARSGEQVRFTSEEYAKYIGV